MEMIVVWLPPPRTKYQFKIAGSMQKKNNHKIHSFLVYALISVVLEYFSHARASVWNPVSFIEFSYLRMSLLYYIRTARARSRINICCWKNRLITNHSWSHLLAYVPHFLNKMPLQHFIFIECAFASTFARTNIFLSII